MANLTLPVVAVPAVLVDSFGNPLTTFLSQIVQAGGSVTVNADGSITIVGLASGTTLTGGLTTDSLTLSTAISRITPGATSLSLRNHANSADNLILTDAGSATLRGLMTSYDGLTTAGLGFPTILAVNHLAAQNASIASVATFTPGADGTFWVQAFIVVTAAGTTATLNCQCTYTDEGSTARTFTIPFAQLNSANQIISILTATGTLAFASAPFMIRAKGANAITILTTATGSPNQTYDISALIGQVA